MFHFQGRLPLFFFLSLQVESVRQRGKEITWWNAFQIKHHFGAKPNNNLCLVFAENNTWMLLAVRVLWWVGGLNMVASALVQEAEKICFGNLDVEVGYRGTHGRDQVGVACARLVSQICDRDT